MAMDSPHPCRSFTVIAPDNRGAGDSSIPPDGNYSAAASAADLKGILVLLNITVIFVFSHDKRDTALVLTKTRSGSPPALSASSPKTHLLYQSRFSQASQTK
ncbi:hypothetical protein QBC40DRAFT_48293 [Triangularia verruculosa]|uniref:Uncharacterized protein n=1 Tax=Triangularia verruculosa TaxID=2587418 RepID=A0AAN6XJH1_9PEZI|nr:hypothetical protein QBC40DRAFT_48293 [Triangularia verruculosa]